MGFVYAFAAAAGLGWAVFAFLLGHLGGDGGGASRLTEDVARVLAQLPPVVESITGVSLEEVVSRIPGMSRKPAPPPAAGGEARNTALPPDRKPR